MDWWIGKVSFRLIDEKLKKTIYDQAPKWSGILTTGARISSGTSGTPAWSASSTGWCWTWRAPTPSRGPGEAWPSARRSWHCCCVQGYCVAEEWGWWDQQSALDCHTYWWLSPTLWNKSVFFTFFTNVSTKSCEIMVWDLFLTINSGFKSFFKI